MSQTAKKTPSNVLNTSSLTPSQTSAVTYLYDNDHNLLLLPVGFGKTIVSLTALCELIDGGYLNRVLVFAPLRVCQLTWATEHKKWAQITHAPVLATGTATQRLNALKSESKIVIMNFENMGWFFKKFKHGHGFDGLLIDELTKLKSVGGKAFKSLRPYLKDFSWRTGMTGTLIEEGAEHLYGQMMIVDEGKTLGRSKDYFMNEYFYPTDYMRYNWALKPDSMDRLVKAIEPFVFTVTDAEYEADLPQLITDYHYIDLPEAARLAYSDMCKDLIAKHEDVEVVAANAAVMTGKLQQISNGFMYDENKNAIFIHDKKLGHCAELVKRHRQIMIVYTYTWELEQLKEMYPDAGVLGAGVKRTEAERIQREWNAKRLNVLLVHPKSAGHGINLQEGGNVIVFFSPIWSKDQTDQVIGRLRRRGQLATFVLAVFLCARATVDDEVIVPRVLGKGEVAGIFRSHLEKRRGG